MKKIINISIALLSIFLIHCERNDLYEFVTSYQKQKSIPQNNYNIVGEQSNIIFITDYQSPIIFADIQRDDKVIVGLRTDTIYLLRYNSDIQSRDESFGNAGVVRIDQSYDQYMINCVKAQPDNKIIAAIEGPGGSYNQSIILRFNSNGTLDYGFGTNGYTTFVDSNYNYSAKSMNLLSTNYIAVLFHCNNNSGVNNIKVNILSQAGVNVGGQEIQNWGGVSYPNHMAIAPDNTIWSSCVYFASPDNSYFAIAGFLPNGSLKTDFGQYGKYQVNFSGSSKAIAIQRVNSQNVSDYKILLAGTSGANPDTKFSVVRLHPSGVNPIDTSFGVNGVFSYQPEGYSWCELKCILVEPDGQIVIGGDCQKNYKQGIIIIKIDKDGRQIDTTFGQNGILEYWNTEYNLYLHSWGIQSSGNLVCAGIFMREFTYFPTLLRIR